MGCYCIWNAPAFLFFHTHLHTDESYLFFEVTYTELFSGISFENIIESHSYCIYISFLQRSPL